jgi:sulfite reductase (NADPH) hemoprotein beta-component
MTKELSRNEHLKEASNFLRGTIKDGLSQELTGAISEDDQQLVKFHGMYLQDDRDLRAERTKKKMEKAFAFMVRLRIPGGELSPAQWLKVDEVARHYANGSMRLTTRQTFQLHGIIKSNVRTTLQSLDKVLLDTMAACGDVNRNVIAGVSPRQTRARTEVLRLARELSDYFKPQGGAYREIWLDGEKIASNEPVDPPNEPIYGARYMPRKFKIAIALPPENDIDVFAHDLGFIAIGDGNGTIAGYNITVGGGMGMTHGEPDTYPRTADVLGYCEAADVVRVAEAILTIQRDWGDRSNRKHARMKYTVEDRGLDTIRTETEKRSGVKLGPPKFYHFDSTGDRIGWVEGEDGSHHLTLFIENGRVKDFPEKQLMTGLREIAKIHKGEFRCTTNQNVVIANVPAEERPAIEKLVARYGLAANLSGLRRNSMACVALPTCGLALAESERYLPSLIAALDEKLALHGLSDEDIVIRMTGCPNGCARPYLAEIGLVGKGPGRYNLYLAAAFDGSRMSKLYAEDLEHDQIVATLEPLFSAYAKGRREKEHFSDFLIRTGVVAPTTNGRDFHANTGPKAA